LEGVILRKREAMSQELIGVISDTHGQFDPKIPSVFKGVNHILHAGDIGGLRVLHQLEQIAPVTAVTGNVDEGNVPPGVDAEKTLQLCGLRIFMIHILGNPQRLAPALQQRVDHVQPDVVVFGHSHKPLIEKHGRVLYFNPGSAGPKRFSLPRSLGLLRVQQGKPHCELIYL
jgi:putative phosphoesterase